MRSWSHTLATVCLAGALAGGCYRGSARDARDRILAEKGWIRVEVPEVRQARENDCGAAALASVLAYWGRPQSLEVVQIGVDARSGGATAGALKRYAREQGLDAFVFPGEIADLRHELEAGRPVIVGVVKPYSPGKGRAHYEVVTGYDPTGERILTFDPARGLRENDLRGFLSEWTAAGRVALVAFEHG